MAVPLAAGQQTALCGLCNLCVTGHPALDGLLKQGYHDQLQLEWTLPRFREFGPSTGLQVGACTTGPVSMDNRDGVCIGANVWIAHPNQCKKLVK